VIPPQRLAAIELRQGFDSIFTDPERPRFRAASRLLFASRMAVARLQRLPTRSGASTVQVDGVAYHSPFDPQSEAGTFYSNLQIEKADVILHFGWGLGYAGNILRNRIKHDARVFVLEPDADLYALSKSDDAEAFQDSRFQFVVGEKVSHFFDEWPLGHSAETDKILWVEWPAALREHGLLAAMLKLQMKAYLRDRTANPPSHFQNGEQYFESAIRNYKYQCSADAGSLFDRFHNVPLVLVSAGPSLDRNIQELRRTEDRCFILAVDTALRPLLASGITPHAVITADPTEANVEHIAGVLPRETYLIAEQAVQPQVLQSAAKCFLFGLGVFPDSLFAKFGLGKTKLESWGSVATTALDLACRMGANPIIFTGQDFAHSWNRDHACNTIFEGKALTVSPAETLRRPDLWGVDVPTTQNLVAYRDFFVRRMKQSPDVRFINATEGGILKSGVELLPLRDVIDQLGKPSVNITKRLADCHSQSKVTVNPRNAIVHLQQALSSAGKNCSCCSEFLELTAKEDLLYRNDAGLEEKLAWGSRLIRDLE